MMKEIWKPCSGFETFYEVSNLGRIRPIAVYSFKYNKILRRKVPKMRTIETTRDGYKRVTLSYYGVQHHCAVHRLVAQTFICNPDNLPCINHKDECPANNNVENLEWCTWKYNSNYGTLPQRIKERMQVNHPTAKAVLQYDRNGNFIAAYKSRKEAARAVGLNGTTISKYINGRIKNRSQYIWKNAI